MNSRLLLQGILVVVLLLVTICIVHLLLVRASKSRGGKVIVHGTYVVTVKDRKFIVNDHITPTLKLRRGVYYEFRNESAEPLYFSSDRHGGEGAPGNLAKHKRGWKGLAKGTIFFIVTDDLPDKFYYQSGEHKDMGGIVEVI